MRSIRITKEELDYIWTQGDETVKEIIDESQEVMVQRGELLRSWIMTSDIFFEGLREEPDGSFTVELGT